MNRPLYSEARQAANIMVTSPIILNTQEKRRALLEVGKAKTKTAHDQEAAVGTYMAQTKFRIWGENPVGTDDGKEAKTTDTKSAAVFSLLTIAGAILAGLILVKLGKKAYRTITKKSKK